MDHHTPGPWRYEYEPGYCGELLASNGRQVAEFVTEPIGADARLIAAAPELLAALRLLMSDPSRNGLITNTVMAARAAIARATEP